MAITIIPADLMPEKRTTDRKRNRINIPQSGAQVWSKMFEVVMKRYRAQIKMLDNIGRDKDRFACFNSCSSAASYNELALPEAIRS